jgi:2-dehydropantoate 2-reductase
MRIAVVATGGVGGYYGAVLAQKKHEVIFIARGAHLRSIQSNGLQIKSVLGDFLITPAQAADKPAEVGPVDLVLFCTKTYDTEMAAQQAKPLVGSPTTIVSLQNGLDAHERIGNIVGIEHMAGGVTGAFPTSRVRESSETRRRPPGSLWGSWMAGALLALRLSATPSMKPALMSKSLKGPCPHCGGNS